MHFEYRITADEYIAAQRLHHKLSAGRSRVERSFFWILAGVFLLVVAGNDEISRGSPILAPILLGAIGTWWIYAGVVHFFPTRYFRRAYRGAELADKVFQADVSEEGFTVAGDALTWGVKWSGVRVKGENERVFLFYSGGTLFMFGKKYLTSEQQQELRRLSGLGVASS